MKVSYFKVFLNLFELKILKVLPVPNACITAKSSYRACPLTNETMVSSFKLPTFASIMLFLLFCYKSVDSPLRLRRILEVQLLPTLFIEENYRID